MRLYFDAQGVPLGAYTEEMRATVGDYPAAAASVDFDEATNPQAVNKINTDWNNIRLVAGVVQYKGNPVSFNADGSAKQQKDAVKQVITNLKAGNLPNQATQCKMWLAVIRQLGYAVD